MVTSRILVVDDAEDTRELYAEYLRFNGYDVHCAADGDEAIKLARVTRPALMVLDLAMPKLPGDEVLRRVKASPKTRNTIVIMLTGHAHGHVVERLRKLGAAEACMKPCLPRELLDRVRAHLGPV